MHMWNACCTVNGAPYCHTVIRPYTHVHVCTCMYLLEHSILVCLNDVLRSLWREKAQAASRHVFRTCDDHVQVMWMTCDKIVQVYQNVLLFRHKVGMNWSSLASSAHLAIIQETYNMATTSPHPLTAHRLWGGLLR